MHQDERRDGRKSTRGLKARIIPLQAAFRALLPFRLALPLRLAVIRERLCRVHIRVLAVALCRYFAYYK
jgi:hypothetical protein